MIRIKYKGVVDAAERYPGDDPVSGLQRELFTFFERGVDALLAELASRPRIKDDLPDLPTTPTFNDLAYFLRDLRAHRVEAHVIDAARADVPGESVLRSIFATPPTAGPEAVARLVRSLATVDGVVDPKGLALAERWEDLKRAAAFPTDEQLPDPADARRQAELCEAVRAHRRDWDSEPEGSPHYRWPNLSLPDVDPPLLPRALAAVRAQAARGGRAPGLSEADIAYCLFSACRHGGSYVQWVGYCRSSRPAAGALLDMISWREWVRPGLRAAWCLSQLDPTLVHEAVAVGRQAFAALDSGVQEVLDAVERHRVEDLIADLERRSRTAGDVDRADKHAMLLRELRPPPHRPSTASAFR